MVVLKTPEQLKLMKQAGRITGEALMKAREVIRPGISTKEIDRVIRAYIEKCGAKPSFLGYGGFPGSACISINSEVIHGIPSAKKILAEGDLVKVDVGAFYQGFHGDSAKTFAVGRISPEAERLMTTTLACFYEGLSRAVAGNRVGDIGSAVSLCAQGAGFSVVREFVGHGVGAKLHEEPDVPNFGTAGRGCRLYPGMTIAIEPMVNAGSEKVRVMSDGWTVVTLDGSLSAHYEHTVAITDEGPILLTDVGE
jgi:methionyl aminopeptidase